MATESQRETATIYTFPARGRFAPAARRDGAGNEREQRDAPTVMGSGWYHDEAIREERAARKDH